MTEFLIIYRYSSDGHELLAILLPSSVISKINDFSYELPLYFTKQSNENHQMQQKQEFITNLITFCKMVLEP